MHENEEMLRSVYDAFAKRDMPMVFSRFSDDITFRVPGEGSMSGFYSGKDEVLAYFATMRNRSGGTFTIEILDVLANDRHGVVLTIERAESGGRTLENPTVHVWDLRDGMCTSFIGYDDGTWDAFWTDAEARRTA